MSGNTGQRTKVNAISAPRLVLLPHRALGEAGPKQSLRGGQRWLQVWAPAVALRGSRANCGGGGSEGSALDRCSCWARDAHDLTGEDAGPLRQSGDTPGPTTC